MVKGKGKKTIVFSKKEFRTIMARDVILTRGEMEKYRIRGVYNAMGDLRVITGDYIRNFASSVFRADLGEVAIIETSLKHHELKTPVQVISVLVFADIYSWHMFALKNWGLYSSAGNDHLITLLN